MYIYVLYYIIIIMTDFKFSKEKKFYFLKAQNTDWNRTTISKIINRYYKLRWEKNSHMSELFDVTKYKVIFLYFCDYLYILIL